MIEVKIVVTNLLHAKRENDKFYFNCRMAGAADANPIVKQFDFDSLTFPSRITPVMKLKR